MKDLPLEVRPREKLLARGSAVLSDTELLAILLRTGLVGKNVLQLASELLDTFGGVAGLLHADAESLSKIKGLGPAKRAELLAVLELVKRSLVQEMHVKTPFNDPSTAQNYLRLTLGHSPVEIFAVLFLNGQNELIVLEEIFRGTLGQTSVYPREVVEKCLQHHAAAVILAHNHPSGSLEASAADIHLTQQLKAALNLLDIRVLDHIIVTQNACLSMASKGLV